MSAALPSAGGSQSRYIQKRLTEFVDRTAEMGRFYDMLKPDGKPVFIVYGAGGMGKTSLLQRMIHEVGLRSLRKSQIVWYDTQPHDYMAVMRKIRDDIDPQCFARFTDLINQYTDRDYSPNRQLNISLQSGSNVVAQGMTVSDRSSVGDVAGIIIKDSYFLVQRQDIAQPESERRRMLTAFLIEGLELASANIMIVVFLDSVEKMSGDTRAWLWEQLLDPVRDGHLPNVRFVVCGQLPPPGDRDWMDYIETAELTPLGVDDVDAYLEKRAPHLPADTRRELAKVVHNFTQGRPADVAAGVDAYLKMPLR